MIERVAGFLKTKFTNDLVCTIENVRYKGRNSHLSVVYSVTVLKYVLKSAKKDL